MKLNEFRSVVVSANDLLTGDVVFLTDKVSWTTNIKDAFVINNKAESYRWLLEARFQRSRVADPYLVELEIDDNVVSFATFKEELRYYGPSNYFHGKRDWEIV